MLFSGKKVLLGITGGIAAYKSAVLTRLLVKEGAQVKVILTDSAKAFITPLTFATLSKNPVVTDLYNTTDGTWSNHVELGRWADIFLVAPATANTIGKMAAGICDNLLLAAYLSARCQVYIAPAMDLDMFAHPSVRTNLRLLKSFGNYIIGPNSGELASGLKGEGRMAEPEEIVAFLASQFLKKDHLKGKTALVTAGPTYEAIDPVRFIGNHSSGKMGFALAEELAGRGTHVVLVTGPTSQVAEHPNIRRIDVVSAQEMHIACLSHFHKCDIAILSAAVADYRPLTAAKEKIKKKSAGLSASEPTLSLDLVETKDILKELSQKKTSRQLLVGFALETANELNFAKEKLKKKNLDFIVLNSLKDKGAGFKGDTNKISILDKNNKISKFELKDKKEVAADIVDYLVQKLSKKNIKKGINKNGN